MPVQVLEDCWHVGSNWTMGFADGFLVFTYHGLIVNVITMIFLECLFEEIVFSVGFLPLLTPKSQYLQLPDEESEGSCNLMLGASCNKPRPKHIDLIMQGLYAAWNFDGINNMF